MRRTQEMLTQPAEEMPVSVQRDKTMDILDIFSWLPARELSIEQAERLVVSLYRGEQKREGYSLKQELPEGASDGVRDAAEELHREGKAVVYLCRADRVIAVAGYSEKREL